MEPLTEATVETIRSAAKLLTSYRRRQFQAEVALRYCGGSARKTETTFGWGRDAVRTGLGELRSGIRCLDSYHLTGRKKTEELCPAIEDHTRRLVEPHTQADPKFQTLFAYTRVTARAVREALLAVPELAGKVPTRQTVGDILNRLGYKLRRVLKARPQKRSPRRTPSSRTSGPAASGPHESPTR
jgi:hypothetical protein